MTKNIIVTALVALVVSLFVGFGIYSKSQSNTEVLGSLSNRDVQAVTLKVGPTGTRYTKLLSGTCNLVSVGVDGVPAWQAKKADCAATGVVSGDNVRITLPRVNGSAVVLANASASTTSGYITVNLLNASSTASAVSIVGTSTAWSVSR